ncbi:MAG: hypothetical protein ACR2OW_09760 [Methyloligellaceae bacterium]
MNQPVKFMFETAFTSKDGQGYQTPEEKAKEDLQVEFTLEKEKIRAEAFEEGRKQGLQEAHATIEAETLECTKAFMASQDSLARQCSDGLQGIRNEATEIALFSSMKLAGDLLSHHPQLPLEHLLKNIFEQIRNLSQVRISVPEKLIDSCQSRIQEMADQFGYEGQVVVSGEPDIAVGDCTIEWTDGGITLDRSKTANLIEQAISQSLNGGPVSLGSKFRTEDPDYELTNCAEFVPENQAQLNPGESQ